MKGRKEGKKEIMFVVKWSHIQAVYGGQHNLKCQGYGYDDQFKKFNRLNVLSLII